MKLYEVQSGEISGFFRTSAPEESFLKAVRRAQTVRDQKVPTPGLLVRVREVTEDHKPVPIKTDPEGWIYYNTLDLLKKL